MIMLRVHRGPWVEHESEPAVFGVTIMIIGALGATVIAAAHMDHIAKNF